MFCDKVLDKIYANPKTRRIPILFVMECIKVFEDVLEDIKEEDPYADLSKLFDERL